MGLKPTCREVHQLASARLDRELTVVERARMQLHLMVCSACRTFDSQLDFMRRAMRRMSDDGPGADHEPK